MLAEELVLPQGHWRWQVPCGLLPLVHQPWDLAPPLPPPPTACRHQRWEPQARQLPGLMGSWHSKLQDCGPGAGVCLLVGWTGVQGTPLPAAGRPRAHSHCPLKGTGPDFTSHANSGMQLRPSVSEYQPQYPWALGPASSELAGPSPTCQQVDISPRPLQPHSLP